MNKFFITFLIIASLFFGCTSTPQLVSVQKTQDKAVSPATVDFGTIWVGEVQAEGEKDNDLSADTAMAVFSSAWAEGEGAGNVYAKKFVSVDTGKTVDMDFLWDDGGTIPAGIYDVFVSIDGNIGEGWIRNLELKANTSYEVTLNFKAARLVIGLEGDGNNITVYSPGTYDKYNSLGRLNDIPDSSVIASYSSYTENNDIYWLVPATPIDILYRHSDGTTDWYTDYTAVPESFIADLP